MPKADLFIDPPLVNAAGFLGFTPERRRPAGLPPFGAFVTNPISLVARLPARTAACLSYPGGFLLHSGYPNPGLRRAIRQWAEAWARSPLPLLVSLLPQEVSDVPVMLAALEGLTGVMGVEISLPPGASVGLTLETVQAAFGELAVLLRLFPEQAISLAPGTIERLLDAGLAAITLGAPRGALLNASGRLVQGRLYGPALFPQALILTQKLVAAGIPVIAGGGVYSHAQAAQLLALGAVAVLLDAVLWRNPGLVAWDRSDSKQRPPPDLDDKAASARG